jgi:hypothetical protein
MAATGSSTGDMPIRDRPAHVSLAAGRRRQTFWTGHGPIRALLPETAIFLVGFALRWFAFTGPTQGDDFAYLEHAHDWVTGTFHPANLDYVYGLRYGVTLPVAAAMRLFGPGTISVALPSLLASMLALVFAIWIGRQLGGTALGRLSGETVAITPITVLSASFVLPEAFLDLALWASLAIAIAARRTNSRLLLFIAGLAGGYGYLVRGYAPVLATLGILPILVSGRFRAASWLWFLAGLSLFPAAEMGYHAWATGDPLWSFHLQSRVYAHLGNLNNSLLFYPGILVRPDWALGILPGLVALAIPAAWRSHTLRVGLSWLLLWFGFLEFAPMDLHPLVWIQKEPRYLSVLVLPAALCVASAIHVTWCRQSRFARGIVIGLYLAMAGIAGLRVEQTAVALRNYMERFKVVARAVGAEKPVGVSFPHFRWALRVNYFAGYPDLYHAYSRAPSGARFRIPGAGEAPRPGEWVVSDPGFFATKGEWKLPHDPLPTWMTGPPDTWPELLRFHGGRVLQVPTIQERSETGTRSGVTVVAPGEVPSRSGLSGDAGKRPAKRRS